MLRIGYIVVPNFQVMIFGGLTVFELANRMTKEPHYDIRLISEGGGPVRSSLGYSVMTDSFDEMVGSTR
jgi:transcriptional regulator GlxA family with amidase domain